LYRFYPTATLVPLNDNTSIAGSIFVDDGSFWTFVPTQKNVATGATSSYVYGGLTMTTRPYTTGTLGTMMILRGNVTNTGNITMSLGIVSATTDTTSNRQSLASSRTLSASPYAPAGNGYVRLVTATDLANFSFNSVSCTGLTGGNMYLATMDIAPNLVPKNFKTYQPNVVASSETIGLPILTGPSDDSSYSLVPGGTFIFKGSQTGT
jgi:hypothetical protein